jgi:hypothetical protein
MAEARITFTIDEEVLQAVRVSAATPTPRCARVLGRRIPRVRERR